MKRIALGSFMHETNTFSPIQTNIDSFRIIQLLVGEEVLNTHKNLKTEIGGIIDIALNGSIKILPTLSATALPAGKITDSTFEYLLSLLLDGIQKAHYEQTLDGVLLVLHGASVTVSCDDPEGYIIKAVRNIVGASIPIVVTLDHHANVTELMVNQSDILLSYRTHPHTDQYEIGCKSAELIIKMIEGKIKPVQKMEKVSMVVPAESSPSMRAKLEARLKDIEKKEDIISASFFIGYPFADIYNIGPAAIVITDGDKSLAEKEAVEFGELIWNLRDDFAIDVPLFEEAIDAVLKSPDKPWVFGDLGDCIMGGGTGDISELFNILLKKNVKNSCAALVDPIAVKQCIDTGIGNAINLQVGGKLLPENFSSLSVRGTIIHISKGTYIGKGYDLSVQTIERGMTVVLDVNGNNLVLTERRSPVHDPEFYRSVGIEPLEQKIIIIDAFYLTVTYKSIAKDIIFLNSPGICNWNFNPDNYKKIPKSIYMFGQNTI